MAVGILNYLIPLNLDPQRPRNSRRVRSFRRAVTVKASLNNSQLRRENLKGGSYGGPEPKREWVADWVSNNDGFVRSLPIYVGGLSLVAVLVNRAVSGIAPVADAGSSQSRADLLTLGLAVTNILNGLVWLSIKPKSISVVDPIGVDCQRIASDLPEFVISELFWAWDSLSNATRCRSLVIVYDSKCILQIGVAAVSSSDDAVLVDANKLMQGSLYQDATKSGSQRYLANLSLYPGKSELPFLPLNTQAVILQPIGDKGIAIIGGDTVRGFTTSDQAWITLIGEKLDATLTKVVSDIPAGGVR
ncbi:protein COFACTOR ASSEMBLY OF COMPLEX C SUBUNIT B CCB4, chloroplastic isoform X1 [Ipomoea triloba]|uniref:protein COFACTOR ASSEMBLY OF COMPLEX C SUBUNIT B CCB4, chloroplastic isoform X1 n=1 Tax=Ipomoea triloba TaxID=35885 RepID=UPI00125DCDCC|nr:protein COFACTOR ASSEMBLY OF COMPLEX C SUBUNIT B CCB4, chloroplastic isoform X1 [Ipomoea triloba]